MQKKWLFLVGLILLVIALIIVLSIKQGEIGLKNKVFKTSSASSLVTEARKLEAGGNLAPAKTAYQKLVNEFSNSSEVMQWQKRCEGLNIKLLFSPEITPKAISYEIKSGDSLVKIAQKFNTTVELLKKSNNISDDRILPGRKIKVWNTPFNILVDKSQNVLFLKSDEEIMKTYTVSTGLNNSTPAGAFKITEKLINPAWFKAGAVVPPGSPENVLGTRWLGFNLAGYGIHGTTDPYSLGKQVTQGCVRMSNADVEELYSIVPKGTEVIIVD